MKSTIHVPQIIRIIIITAIAGLIIGCKTRSISDSGYRPDGAPLRSWSGRTYTDDREPFGYRGELSEFDVLGIERGGAVTDEQIAKTLDSAIKVGIRKGSTVMLIQSGAYTPDEPMRSEMSKCFTVIPFDGRPDSANKGLSYARSLRLAAAQAGCETIICYWGTLETAKRDLGTKVVSWVPVVGGMFPDENQQMRIRLKVAVINVRGGNWTEFSPDTFDNALVSATYNRGTADQMQVQKLKRQAYEAAAKDLVKIYAN